MPAKARIIACAALALAAGCTDAPQSSVPLTSSGATALVGLDASEVVARIGPPRARGAASLSYQTRRSGPPARQTQASTSLGGGGTSSSLSVGRTVLTCDWTFRLDANDRVTGWTNSGTLCPVL